MSRIIYFKDKRHFLVSEGISFLKKKKNKKEKNNSTFR